MKLFVFAAACVLTFLLCGMLVGQTMPSGAKPGHLRMALVNMKSLFSSVDRANIQKNLERHMYFIDRAVAQGAEFVGFPELAVSGYSFKNVPWLRLDGPEVQALARKAVEKGIYISSGIAEEDGQGKRWNTQFVIDPSGKVIGWHHKVWLTDEHGHTERGTDHNVFVVKGIKMGIITCADGSDYQNLKATVDNGAQILYGPHANTTKGTTQGWYNFRAKWAGEWDGKMVPLQTSNGGPAMDGPSGGWCNQLKVYAAIHNHAALYSQQYDPPPGEEPRTRGWASGAWFIGPDGQTLAQMPPSSNPSDSREYLLLCDIPVPATK